MRYCRADRKRRRGDPTSVRIARMTHLPVADTRCLLRVKSAGSAQARLRPLTSAELTSSAASDFVANVPHPDLGADAAKPSVAIMCAHLLSEPRDSQVNAPHHCENRSHPYPPWPTPARPASGEQRSYRADHERAERGRGGPAVPPYLGHQKVHCGIGDIAGTVHTQKDDAERRIDSNQRKPLRSRYHIDDREPCTVGEGEATKCGSGRHDPKPLISLMT